MSNAVRYLLALAVPLALLGPARSDDLVSMRELFAPGGQYHVSSRVELTGSLTPPADKSAQSSKPLTIAGTSAIEYDERILSLKDSVVQRTLRLYRRVDLQRKMGEQAQKSELRPSVRRLVIMRNKNTKVPFSPDGPLTWSEIDLLRTDIFTPALAGLLPINAVKVGERWAAGPEAVAELTDMEKIEEGGLECRLEELTNLAGRRHARVSLTGSVRGVNEDGPTRQQLDGYFYFDLESNHLSYLTFKGSHLLLDGQGKESGRVEGKFVLTRQANQRTGDLSDEALRGITLEPNAENTLLLYDNPELSVRFLYPRRWRVGMVRGRQITIDEPNGNGILLTLDPPGRVPASAQFLTESRDFLQNQKAKVLRVEQPRRLANPPHELEQFALEIEIMGQKPTMDYYIARQANGGATLAARLLPADLAGLRHDVERIARSVTITAPLK